MQSNYADITATKNGQKIRINTVDVYKNGELTKREAAAAESIKSNTGKEIITIPKGKTIEIVEKLNSGWYKVNYSGKTGYVSSKYVRL